MATKSQQILETQAQVEQNLLQEALTEAHGALAKSNFQSEVLQEKLSQLDMMMDNKGWSSVSEYDDDGPDLKQIHNTASQARNLLALNTWIKQGLRLRHNFIWQNGIHYTGVPAKSDGRSKTANVQDRIELPANERNFFGEQAREKREAALYTDGFAPYIGNDNTFELQAMPVGQISADYRNPDDSSEVWAYRRTWSHYPQGSADPTVRNEWIFRNGFTDKRTTSIKLNDKVEPVAQDKRIFGTPVNSQTGWAYGLGDCLAAIAWVKMYRDFIVNGFTVTSAMAQIWAVAKSSAQKGAEGAVAAINGGGVGRTASVGVSDSLTPLSTAGQAYAFEKGSAIIAAAAAAIEVSAIALTADTSNAGSSYGSAQTLDLPTRLAMEARRRYHKNLDTEVLIWLGATDDVDVWFVPYFESTEAYRAAQAVKLRWDTGLYTAEQAKAEFEALAGRSAKSPVPDGVLLPNNEKSLPRNDIDSDTAAGTDPTNATTTGQGQGAGDGDGPRSNDTRDDTQS